MNTPSCILVLAFGLVASSLSAVESIVPLADLPRPIRTAIAEHTGGGAIERITVDDSQGTVIYTAHFRSAQDKTVHALRISGEGRVLAEGSSTSEPAIGAPSTGVPLSEAPPATGATP